MLAQLFTIVAPVYVCAGLGFAWIKSGRRYDAELVTELIFLIGAPCLIFSKLVGIEIDRALILKMSVATALAMVGFILCGLVLLRPLRLRTNVYLAPLVFGNSGNLGLPICLFAFGDDGVALGSCYFATSTLLHFTVGIRIWSGRMSLGQLARIPLTYAVLLAALVLTFELPVPLWVLNATDLLGSFTIPLMAFTLGVTIGRLGLGKIRRSLLLASIRLPIGIGVGLLVASLVGLTGVARGVFIIDCVMPPAVFGYLLSQKYDRSPEEVASLVVVSTLLIFVTLPVILHFVLQSAGAG